MTRPTRTNDSNGRPTSRRLPDRAVDVVVQRTANPPRPAAQQPAARPATRAPSASSAQRQAASPQKKKRKMTAGKVAKSAAALMLITAFGYASGFIYKVYDPKVGIKTQINSILDLR